MRARRPAHVLVALLLLLSTGALFTVLATAHWSTLDQDIDAMTRQQQAAAYLRPAVRLVDTLAGVRSQAVRGEPSAAADLAEPLDALQAADGPPETTAGEQGLRATVEALGSGGNRVALLTDALDRAVDLVEAAASTGGLTGTGGSPQYLADAVAVHLPRLVVHTVDVADAAWTARDTTGSERTAWLVRIESSRVAAAGVLADLETALHSASTLDGAVAERSTRLDAVRDAAGPIGGLRALTPAPVAPDATAAADTAVAVRDAARLSTSALLSIMDEILATTASDLRAERAQLLMLVGAGGALAAALLWWSVPRPRTDDGTTTPATSSDDIAEISVQPVVDAHDLLGEQELLHVGRGVRARPRETNDDAE